MGKLGNKDGQPDRAKLSRGRLQKDRILEEMEPDRPAKAFIAGLEMAFHQIEDHGDQLRQAVALRGHFRIMADGDKHAVLLVHFKDEFWLHGKMFKLSDGNH